MNKRILLTGASGFVGRALLKHLLGRGCEVRVALRRDIELEGAEPVVIGDINDRTDWQTALADVDCVVHLAARVHQLHDQSADPLADYRSVNTAPTLRLAQQAAQFGVRRFVYLSTAKIYGEHSLQRAFRENDTPDPQDAYALSKWEAEQGLQQICSHRGMQFCILRPPLVYGPGVGANFLRLMDHVAQRKRLPMGAIRNRRSLVSLQNLVAAIYLCMTHPDAAGQSFNISDGEDLSTPDLARRIAQSLGIESRLLTVPPNVLRVGLTLLGRGAEADRLLGDFALDISHLRQQLAWQPQSMKSGLQETAHWYRAYRHLSRIRA